MIIFTIFSILAGFSALISAILAVYVYFHRASCESALTFSGLMAASFVYSTAYAVELHMKELETVILFLKLEYLGVVFIPVLWFLFSVTFAESENTLRRVDPFRWLLNLLLFIIPAVTIALVWSNEYHHLMYTDIWLQKGVPLSVIVTKRGPWFWIFMVYVYIFLLLGTIRLLSRIKTSRDEFRGQSILLLAGAVVPWFANAAIVFQITPYGLDLVPIAFSFSGILLYLAIFRFRLFDLVPIARSMVMESIQDGLIVLDRHDRLVDVNAAAREILPRLNQYSMGTSADVVFSNLPVNRKEIPYSVDVPLFIKGRERHFRVNAMTIAPDGRHQVGAVVLFRDITETRELLEKLERLASIDELTGVYNRRHFLILAEREISIARRMGNGLVITILDLDHFKNVNDTHGHIAGDQVLEQVCRLIENSMRNTDIIARYGGEEFVILFPSTILYQAKVMIERLRQSLETMTFKTIAGEIQITGSFGLAELDGNNPDEDLESCLILADKALYLAKSRGRNRLETAAARENLSV